MSKRRQKNPRGTNGGRRPAPLPKGASLVHSEDGIVSYLCSCGINFTEKKSLIRHCDSRCYVPNEQESKKRKVETDLSLVDSLLESSSSQNSTCYLSEDLEGCHLLEGE